MLSWEGGEVLTLEGDDDVEVRYIHVGSVKRFRGEHVEER